MVKLIRPHGYIYVHIWVSDETTEMLEGRVGLQLQMQATARLLVAPQLQQNPNPNQLPTLTTKTHSRLLISHQELRI